jgi:hypothetical protein
MKLPLPVEQEKMNRGYGCLLTPLFFFQAVIEAVDSVANE